MADFSGPPINVCSKVRPKWRIVYHEIC